MYLGSTSHPQPNGQERRLISSTHNSFADVKPYRPHHRRRQRSGKRPVRLRCREAGFSIALVGRRADRLAAVERDIIEAGGTALALPMDVSDEAAVIAAFQGVRERFGRLDLLFNNAGVNAAATPIDQISLEAWRQTVD